MNQNLDILLTALYVDLDDQVLLSLGWSREHRPGRKPRLKNAELLCLVVAQRLLGFASERHWVRFARAYLRDAFPAMPQQSGHSKRVRAAVGVVASVIAFPAHDADSRQDALRLLDSTPVPCGPRETRWNSLTSPALPATGTARRSPAGSGASGSTWSAPQRACRSSGVWPHPR